MAFGLKHALNSSDESFAVSAQQKLDALNRSLAVIEFTPDGLIADANENFLKTFGFSRHEVVGKHHRILVEPSYAASSAYRTFWNSLGQGEFQGGEFARVGAGGRRVWLEATYNPVKDASGRVRRIVKFATDITAKKIESDRLWSMIGSMPIAVMTVDPKDDFKINYMNETSKSLLRSIEEHLPIPVDKMLGVSFDVFHKNPGHQRRMLADDKSLPFRTKIKLGPEVLELRISAVRDADGGYLGPMLSWAVVTAQEQVAQVVEGVVDEVARTSEGVRAAAASLSDTAESARSRASSVAASAEEMTATILEIAGQVTRVSARAGDIAAQAMSTDGRVKELAANATKVEAVVSLIQQIASQTNLLALNATIEAARAGDAGRGFAVVAGEVKALAGQTSKATEEISRQVSLIQASSSDAVTAMETITEAVGELSSLTTAIAGAVEEQASTTSEMSGNISEVSASAAATGEMASDLRNAALRLSETASGMKDSVNGFLARG